jgi:hypothetical protein
MAPIGVDALVLSAATALLCMEMLTLVVGIDHAAAAVAPDHDEQSSDLGEP